MNTSSWFLKISSRQRIWLCATVLGMLAIVALGILLSSSSKPRESTGLSASMSIQNIAPKLGVTPKGLARELELPLNISKNKPLSLFGVTDKELQHAAEHILSHNDSILKYYVYVALFLWGLVFLVRLGRPDGSDIKDRSCWYPRAPFIIALLFSVAVAGFILGKSPNPMESAVKVFKSMVGLYPDPAAKVIAFGFFIILAVIGNKIICGWACPFGALQELIYSIPILRNIKKKSLPFVFTNTIRVLFFIVTLLFLFGVIGGRRGFVIYHYANPFNLFNLDFETSGILRRIIIVLLISLIIYRPFCQLICPFGLISWIVERFSIFRIQIDKEKCTQCGACVKACPLEAAKGRVDGKKMPADCFSCARCLSTCPVDAIKYVPFFSKKGNTYKYSLKNRAKQ